MALSEDTTTPPVVDYTEWARARAALVPREKAHTREGDAIAAARRRLPMTELDAQTTFIGADGPATLLSLFDGRRQLIIYKHMWHHGKPYAQQCEGCTGTVWDLPEPSYLNDRGVSLVVVTEGSWDEAAPFREFMGYRTPWYSAAGLEGPVFGTDFGQFLSLLRVGERVYLTGSIDARGTEVNMTSYRLLDTTVYGRQETWEDSPEGWPQEPTYSGWRRNGRPTPQWTRLQQGAVDPTTDADSVDGGCCGGAPGIAE